MVLTRTTLQQVLSEVCGAGIEGFQLHFLDDAAYQKLKTEKAYHDVVKMTTKDIAALPRGSVDTRFLLVSHTSTANTIVDVLKDLQEVLILLKSRTGVKISTSEPCTILFLTNNDFIKLSI